MSILTNAQKAVHKLNNVHVYDYLKQHLNDIILTLDDYLDLTSNLNQAPYNIVNILSDCWLKRDHLPQIKLRHIAIDLDTNTYKRPNLFSNRFYQFETDFPAVLLDYLVDNDYLFIGDYTAPITNNDSLNQYFDPFMRMLLSTVPNNMTLHKIAFKDDWISVECNLGINYDFSFAKYKSTNNLNQLARNYQANLALTDFIDREYNYNMFFPCTLNEISQFNLALTNMPNAAAIKKALKRLYVPSVSNSIDNFEIAETNKKQFESMPAYQIEQHIHQQN